MTDIEKYVDKIEVSDLDIQTNQYDFSRDLHTFYEYVETCKIKRSHRNNKLSKMDLSRLAKIISKNSSIKFKKDDDQVVSWIEFIDKSALKLKIVKYNTEGIFMGYQSSVESYPDNYITCLADKYKGLIDLSILDQERIILNTFVSDYSKSNNELYTSSPLGRLSCFSIFGCGMGVVPYINFGNARNFILNILKDFQEGTWYSTESLIKFLQKYHANFLIPETLNDQYNKIIKEGKYQYFHEKKKEGPYGIQILESHSDAFQRVEGRWLERFLEGIPFILGYVDIAYSNGADNDLIPEIGMIKAFKVSGKLKKVLNKTPIEYKLFILPNFELHIESEAYPAKIVSLVKNFGKTVSMDKKIIIKLIKKNTLDFIKENPGFDILSLINDISCKEVPQNVIMEIKEWIHASDSFLLYEDHALFEGDDSIEGIKDFLIEKISPKLFIIQNPEQLFDFLEKKELVPYKVKHSSSSIKPLSKDCRTVFPKEEELKQKKQSAVIIKETLITYYFPTLIIMEDFQKKLIELKCPVISDNEKLSLSFYKKQGPVIKQCINELKHKYIFQVKD